MPDLHGYAVLVDGHSIAAEVPRFFSGRLPDLKLGTSDGASCDAALELLAAQVIAAATGFTPGCSVKKRSSWSSVA